MKRQNLRTVSLIVVTFTYLLIGAAIFGYLESEHEIRQRESLELIELIVKRKYNISDDDFTVLTTTVIKSVPHKAGIQWKFPGAFYFATTVVTTIGYGHSTPATMAGRSFCMIYALIGIPLGLVMFQSIGERLNTFVGSALKYAKRCFKAANPEVTQTNLVMVVSVLSTILMTSMAAVFAKYERWDYFDSLYYCFITLTTIGFGDYVALQKESALQSKPEYVVLSLIFILFGLSVVSSAVNLLVLKFLTLNTEDERRDEQLRYTANLNPIQLKGDVITSSGGHGYHPEEAPADGPLEALNGSTGRVRSRPPRPATLNSCSLDSFISARPQTTPEEHLPAETSELDSELEPSSRYPHHYNHHHHHHYRHHHHHAVSEHTNLTKPSARDRLERQPPDTQALLYSSQFELTNQCDRWGQPQCPHCWSEAVTSVGQDSQRVGAHSPPMDACPCSWISLHDQQQARDDPSRSRRMLEPEPLGKRRPPRRVQPHQTPNSRALSSGESSLVGHQHKHRSAKVDPACGPVHNDYLTSCQLERLHSAAQARKAQLDRMPDNRLAAEHQTSSVNARARLQGAQSASRLPTTTSLPAEEARRHFRSNSSRSLAESAKRASLPEDRAPSSPALSHQHLEISSLKPAGLAINNQRSPAATKAKLVCRCCCGHLECIQHAIELQSAQRLALSKQSENQNHAHKFNQELDISPNTRQGASGQLEPEIFSIQVGSANSCDSEANNSE